MSKIAKVALPRCRVMLPAAIGLLFCAVAGCTPAQRMELTMFAQDFLRNLLFGLAF